GLLHLVYSLFLQRGYQVADLSVVYPIARGTGPMLSTIGAFLLLGETPSTYGVLGLIAIVSGIVLISTQGNLAKFRQPEARTGVRWGTVTGGAIAGYTVEIGRASCREGVWISEGIRDFHVTGVQTCALPICFRPSGHSCSWAKLPAPTEYWG